MLLRSGFSAEVHGFSIKLLACSLQVKALALKSFGFSAEVLGFNFKRGCRERKAESGDRRMSEGGAFDGLEIMFSRY